MSHRRGGGAFDVVLGGESPAEPSERSRYLSSYADAGATWWLEQLTDWRGTLEEMRGLIRAGPPRQ
jgi:hypothetical protein